MNAMNIRTTIEKGGTGIEKGGTGIEKGGTGIEKNGTGIEKGGTGIRAFRHAGLVIAGLLFSAGTFAAPTGTWEDWGDLGGTLQFGVQNKSTLTASWSTFDAAGNPVLLIGAGQLGEGAISMPLYKVVTGFQTPGKPMPMMVEWGRVSLSFDQCGNAQGSVFALKSENAGTGKSENAGTGKSENAGTGKSENAGTGKSENAGTGKSENAGTGKSENAGTGNKYLPLGQVVLIGPKAGGCS